MASSHVARIRRSDRLIVRRSNACGACRRPLRRQDREPVRDQVRLGRRQGFAPVELVLASYENTSSSRTPSATAMRNATSSDGEYLPASIALIVCRVTPTSSARSCCVISLRSNRNRRIVLLIVVWLMLKRRGDGKRSVPCS